MNRVVILVFEQVDLLDVGGPYEVFLTADRLHQRSGGSPIFEVVIASPDGEPVTSFGGMGLVPQIAVSEVDQADVVVVPGAVAIDAVCASPVVAEAVAVLIRLATITASVCTGAFLLADQGVLDGLRWTTHFEDVEDLAQRMSSDKGLERVRWVDTGAVVTAGGLSNGLAMSLHLVERLAGRELAVTTANQIEYDWDPDDGIHASSAEQ